MNIWKYWKISHVPWTRGSTVYNYTLSHQKNTICPQTLRKINLNSARKFSINSEKEIVGITISCFSIYLKTYSGSSSERTTQVAKGPRQVATWKKVLSLPCIHLYPPPPPLSLSLSLLTLSLSLALTIPHLQNIRKIKIIHTVNGNKPDISNNIMPHNLSEIL